jgi:hypothetical protein
MNTYFIGRIRLKESKTKQADLGPGSSPVQQYAAHADQQHAAALDDLLNLWDDDEDGPRPTSHKEQAALPPSKSGCGIPLIADTAPGVCLSSLSHALPLLLQHAQGQNIQGLHDHALAMISHPDDKLGASSTHAKVNATHGWLVDPTTKSALANHHSATKPSRKRLR